MKKELILRGCSLALVASCLGGASPAGAGGFHFYDRESARGLEADGAAFSNVLYDEYSTLSGLVDPVDSELFNRKARSAASRAAVQVESSRDRHLSVDEAVVFDRALGAMLTMFDRGATVVAPDQAARAQVRYDCWIEAAEESGVDSVRAESCREDFREAMLALDEVADFALTETASYAVSAAEPHPHHPYERGLRSGGVGVVSYRVYFDFGGTLPTAAGGESLQEAISVAKRLPNAKLRVVAHTDRSGSKYYNQQLSQRRLSFVMKSMASSGVDVGRVAPFALGENRPLVPTEDGVREEGNRVVEIFVLRGGEGRPRPEDQS